MDFDMQLSGWGRTPEIDAKGFWFEKSRKLAAYLKSAPRQTCIAHGMGRSYGDSALNADVVFTTDFNKVLSFDDQSGVLTCEAGLSLDEMIRAFLPRGWFPGVTPGTRFVTVGGAISSDVHGKNHHWAGCFTNDVISLDLMLPDGEILEVSREKNSDWFYATCGGMGLTGIILHATIQLRRVNSGYIRETDIRAHNLEETLLLFKRHETATYSVAWIDCLAKGNNLGRSVLILGEQAPEGSLKIFPEKRPLSVFVDLPGIFLNKYSISVFNQLYYDKHPTCLNGKTTPWHAFFHPLDIIHNWNRIYGSKGFTQYQVVLPKSACPEGMETLLARISRSGLGSFLAVLKELGPQNDNWLSFPIEGYTLALDFKLQNGLLKLLNELDRIVIDYSGRLYLAKDVRMSKNTFRQTYPNWEKFVQFRETHRLKTKFDSLQSKRLGI